MKTNYSLLLVLIVLLITVKINAQSIVVNDPADPETAYTAEELIQNVLIRGGCATIELEYLQENPDGTTNPAQKSWGYFKKGTSNFPFDDGIIIGSMYATSAEGPNDNGGVSDPGNNWVGDNDLKVILDNDNGDVNDTNNATVFQFKFTPNNDFVSFDFIFGSEEYENQFECSSAFRDGFAFLIRGPGIPNDSGTAFGGTNIASIPGSANIPVSTATIHDAGFMCGTENTGVNFFPTMYVSNQGANNQNEVQLDGYTTVLTAQANVVPGQEYTMKMVIADRGDTAYDSAVFLRGGSLDLGGGLGDDITIADGTAPCEGDIVTLDATTDSGTVTPTYVWYYNGVVIPGETGPTIDVTNAGTYSVDIVYSSTCVASDSVIVEFEVPVDAGTNGVITLCDDNAAVDYLRNSAVPHKPEEHGQDQVC